MIKAHALYEVSDWEEISNHSEDSNYLENLIRNRQNIVICSVKDESEIPKAVEEMASRLLENHAVMEDVIHTLRKNFIEKKEDFSLPMEEKTWEEKNMVYELLRDMYGVISCITFSSDGILHGKLVMTPRAQKFINGEYMEIAAYQRVKKIVETLSEKYRKECKIYRNVLVSTREGIYRNEFDMVILFDNMFYIVEVKSGKNFRDFEKYRELGKEYRVVPERFLLIDSCITEAHAEMIHYFLEYYASNLNPASLQEKIEIMIEKDQREGLE